MITKMAQTPSPVCCASPSPERSPELAPDDRRRATLAGFYHPSESRGDLRELEDEGTVVGEDCSAEGEVNLEVSKLGTFTFSAPFFLSSEP